MKKAISILIVSIIVLTASLTFAACGDSISNGTYEKKGEGYNLLGSDEFTIKGSTLIVDMGLEGIPIVNYDYKISDGEITLSIQGNIVMSFSFEKKDKSVFLNSVEYVKK